MVTYLGFWPPAQPTRTVVTSLGSRPPAQPTRTHGHVPRRRASGLADSDSFRLPAHAGPVRPRDAVDGRNMAPDHWPLDRWGIPRSRLGHGCLWRYRTPPPGARASSPCRVARGASGPPQRMRMSRARLSPPPHADPPSTNRSRASAPYRQVLWRSWCELRGRRYVSEPPHTGKPPRQSPGWPDAGSGLSGPVGWTSSPPRGAFRHAPGWPGLGTGSARHEGRTTSHHPTTHHLTVRTPSCRRTWLGSTPKGSPPDPLMRSSGWTTLTTCNIRDTMEGASSVLPVDVDAVLGSLLSVCRIRRSVGGRE